MSDCYTFTSTDADIILLSNDEPQPVEFHVHRAILSAASPFFNAMFSLPQPSTCEILPRIPLTEPAAILDPLLRLIYPIPPPSLSTLDLVVSLLGVATKYDIPTAVTTLRTNLTQQQWLSTCATRVYAIACRFDLDAEARLASRYTLSTPILDAPLHDDLRHITAHDYHRLLELHRTRARAAIEKLVVPEGVKCMQCNGSSYAVFGAPKWWGEFERRAKEELASRPVSGTLFELETLSGVVQGAACVRCAGSVLDSWRFLGELKKEIDALPDTI